MTIEEDIHGIIDSPPAPPNLPPNLMEARDLSHWGSVVFLVFSALFAISGIYNFFLGFACIYCRSDIFWGIVDLFLAVLAFVGADSTRRTIIPAIDAQDVNRARNETVKWMIIGIFTGFIPGILLILAYSSLGNRQNYVQWQASGNVPDYPSVQGNAPSGESGYQTPPTQKLHCPYCGAEVQPEWNVCPKCGAKLR